MYIGRFAPSPTGPLHLGSLYTALASFLDARHHQGKWLVRIDDVDIPRNAPGAADLILKTLEAFGLHWDETIYYESRHFNHYESALARLKALNLLYPCTCSRKKLADYAQHHGGGDRYPGICRDKNFHEQNDYAVRIRTDGAFIEFIDRLQGRFSENLNAAHGDFIIKRKDHLFAYQLAVVVDDQAQGVTHIVRGIDLLDSTSKQIFLQMLLGYPLPSYMHLPILVDQKGQKLSKQTYAQAVDQRNPGPVLFHLLQLLKQAPPEELIDALPQEILQWGISHWNPAPLQSWTQLCPSNGFVGLN
ncbi:tRNA glutamyl-Q(34) synthetase GluQRS [Methylicorpusculum sp.]|uniref:tRNA glutamyl-Q(34) synthetase GluQRS n=1 Tax=Methylicorpusculum sp. TaxID=2713644 RepID=UPI00351EB55E